MNFLKRIPWEIVIALLLNAVVAFALFSMHGKITVNAEPPREIRVDISDYTPVQPKEMKIPEDVAKNQTGQSGASDAGAVLNNPEAVNQLAAAAMRDFAVPVEAPSALKNVTGAERKEALSRIEQGISVFDGIAGVKAGLPSGASAGGIYAGASFKSRGDAAVRGKLLKQHGGDDSTEKSVEKTLKYLASVQNPSGSWGSKESFKTGDAVALSSLSMLAFFAHGENFQSERYGEVIRKGCDFLVEAASVPGIERVGKGFGHAILTYALAEGYAISGSISLLNALEPRLKYIIANQNKFGSFAPDYDNSPAAPPTAEQQEDPFFKEVITGEPICDLSLLGWHIQALTAAKNAGVSVEGLDRALDLAAESLVKIHQADKGGFSQGINLRKLPPSDNMTPVGLLGMQLLNSGKSNPALRAERIIERLPSPKWSDRKDYPLYRWYYQTQALFQSERGRGRRWDIWNANLKNELMKVQNPDGSWGVPAGESGFRLKNKVDLAVYASSMCSLMLQVYYRYLPSYSIAEAVDNSQRANSYDIGGGMITVLPGGADPMAAIILGMGDSGMSPVKFGVFNNKPSTSEDGLVKEEFSRFASMNTTIPVRKVEDWPQTLQPNQRIALFLDDLAPRNFKGHLRLRLGIVGTEKDINYYRLSFEAVMNGKRLYNSHLLRHRQMVDIVIPNDIFLPFGNILQIRNNGKRVMAFDAAELSSVEKLGVGLYLNTGNLGELPPSIRQFFKKPAPADAIICPLSANAENQQLLSEITGYEDDKCYIGEYSAFGTEYMGNEFQKHYLRQTGREIIDWIAGGGSGVKINGIVSGGKFFDTVFKTEYPAMTALRQVAKLFEGTPHRLPVQLYPKYGEKPLLFASAAAAYNAPGVATIVLARRFALPDEIEFTAILPWSGATDMKIEKGFFPPESPFVYVATPLEKEQKRITVENGVIRYSGLFPEITVIRLVQQGAQELAPPPPATDYIPEIKVNPTFMLNSIPQTDAKLKKYSMRQPGGHAAPYGQNAGFSVVPVTTYKAPRTPDFTPPEMESVQVVFRANASVKNRFDSVYLALGAAAPFAKYLSFYVYPRTAGLGKHEKMAFAMLRFTLKGQMYTKSVPVERWTMMVLPLVDGNDPSWGELRILEPVGVFWPKLQSIFFEINDVSVWAP